MAAIHCTTVLTGAGLLMKVLAHWSDLFNRTQCVQLINTGVEVCAGIGVSCKQLNEGRSFTESEVCLRSSLWIYTRS